ncbi:MAG: hypothetical protein U0169_02575 [Polyangiaceae bacterium]
MGPSPASSGSPTPAVPDPRERIARIRTLASRALWFWKTTLLVVILGSAISLVTATRVKRMYRSECKVLFKSGVTERDELPASEKAVRLAPKLKEMLLTRGRLERVINEFKLYPKIVDSRGLLDAVEEMRGHVGFRGSESQTYVISFEGDTPEEVQKVTQRLAETMIEEFDKSNSSVVKEQAAFLEGEVARAEADLEVSNKALATFLALHPEFARAAQAAQLGAGAGTATPTAGGVPTPTSSDPQLAALYARRARTLDEARAANPSAIPDPNAAANAARIEEATRVRDEAARAAAAAQSDLALKKTQFTDQHPDMIAARAQADVSARALQAADAKLQQARAAANSGFTPPPGSVSPELKARLDQLDAQIAARQNELRKANSASPLASVAPKGLEYVELETEWQRLLRSLSSAKLKHQDLRDKLEKARLQASAVAIGDHMEVIDPAFKPVHPSKGGRTNVALIGIAMTAFFSLLYAFARVVFSDWVIDEGDIKALGVIPVLGVMPKLPPAPAIPKEGPSGVL